MLAATRKSSHLASDESVTFISDYKKRRAEKVMSDQKNKVKELKKLCSFKIVQ